MKAIRNTVLIAAVVLLAICRDVALRGDDSPRERFLSEAPKGWAALAQQAESIEARGVWKHEARAGNQEKIISRDYVYKRNGRRMLEHQLHLQPKPPLGVLPESVFATNDQYAFLLMKAGRDGAWLLNRTLTPDDPIVKTAAMESMPRTFVEASWVLSGISLPELRRSKGFQLTDVQTIEQKGESLVKVFFEFKPDPEDPPTAIRGGWMLLDPRRQWGLRSVETKAVWGRIEQTITYRSPPDQLPVINRVAVKMIGDSEEGGVATDEFEFEEYRSRQIPDSEFKLPAFGLPERTTDKTADSAQVELVIEGEKISVGQVAVGKESKLRVSIGNRSSKTVTIVGASDGCSLHGCTETKGLPLAIAAGETKELEVLFKAGRSGSVQHPQTFHYRSGETLKSLPIQITGTIVAGNE